MISLLFQIKIIHSFIDSRQITKALESETIQKLRRDGNKTLSSLAERSQWISSSKDVKRAVSISYDSCNAVERVTKRLEQLKQERMERLKELARYKTLQDEAEEVSDTFKLLFDNL